MKEDSNYFSLGVFVDCMKTFSIEVKANDTLPFLVRRILAAAGLHPGYCHFLQFSNDFKIFPNCVDFSKLTLAAIGISQDAEVFFKIRKPIRPHAFNVELIHGGELQFIELNPNGKDSILDLKRMARDIFGIEAKNQIWKRGCEILHDCHIIQDDESQSAFIIQCKE